MRTGGETLIVSQNRSKRGCERGSFSADVIDLSSYRKRYLFRSAHTIFYLNENGLWLDYLLGYKLLHPRDVRSAKTLETMLLIHNPELILIESHLSWSDPFETSKNLSERLQVPIVMICGPESKSKKILKKAYSAGVHDTLFTPLNKDELFETLQVLLKFQNQVSQLQ